MSIYEILSFFDGKTVRSQRTQGEFLKKEMNQPLDTICATESLFEGTVLDFDLDRCNGGGIYAAHMWEPS